MVPTLFLLAKRDIPILTDRAMKDFRTSCIIVMLCVLLASCERDFSFSPQTVISVESADQKAVAEWFAWLFASPGGFVPIVKENAFDADVLLRTDASMPESSYRIKVTGRHTCVEASSSIGFFYALQRLFRALPDDINGVRHADHVKWTIPSMSVYDAPTTGCSGLVLDMSCRIVSKENVMYLIEAMSDMNVYELTIINDSCYTKADIEQMHQYALKHNVKLLSQVEVNGVSRPCSGRV